MFEVGEHAYLAKQITQSATGDTPAFLLGERGERVEVLKTGLDGPFPYLVEGPSNPGNPWRAEEGDLMRTKPMAFN